MPEQVIHRSERFAKAARAERDRLARKRSQLFKKREDLQVKVDALDEELEAVEEEIQQLESFALVEKDDGALPVREVESLDQNNPDLLSGAIIRTLAVPLLLETQGTAPIHYRDWLELLNRKGYAVAGKRPDAVFLNQVARSPVVHATTKAGYYAIDLDAIEQLRQKLHRQHGELAEHIESLPSSVAEFEQHRERQRELNTAIGRTERELDEAMNALKPIQPEAPEIKAA